VPELTEIDEARRLIAERATPLPSEPVPLREALGRVLGADVTASDPVPGFDNSAMDGFAVRAADVRSASTGAPVALAVVDESRAGHPARREVGEGEAIAISTGAPFPGGADAVVRLEDARAADGTVEVAVAVEAGLHVRRAGDDVTPGQVVMEPGTAIGPAELGVLASVGRVEVECTRAPRISVVTTGDELAEPGEPLPPGGVRNSNAYSIPALVERAGARLANLEVAADDAEATRDAIGRALDADVVVVCGGVSVGHHDHVRGAFSALGVEQVFWGVALRPGKPTAFGIAAAGTLVFGLPGNPVSAMVTFLLFVRPAVDAMLGADPRRHRATAALAEDYRKQPGRAHAVRCTLELHDHGWLARPTGDQASHILTSMLGAECLATIPSESGDVGAGTRVEIELLP
jgi:molybdopterin molybdotransferase